MADKKEKKEKTEIPYTQKPDFKYQLTQQYMLDYVANTQPPEVQLWYCDLVDSCRQTITRGGKNIETVKLDDVRKEFITKFLGEDYFKQKAAKKVTYKDKIAELRKKAEAALNK